MRAQSINVGLGALRRNNGALFAHIREAVDLLLAGKSAGSALASFSTITHSDVGPYTRNANFWGASFVSSITPISVSNSLSGDGQLFGTAITPRHVLYVDHAKPIDGTTLRFVDASNNIVLRTQSAVATVAGSVDLAVGRLSSDLPASIGFCKVLPVRFHTYFRPRLPVVVFDQVRNGLVQDLMEIASPGNICRTWAPVDAKRLEFYEAVVGGDSGGPWGVLINREFVIMCSQNNVAGSGVTSQAFSNPAFDLNAAINAAIVTVDGGSPTNYTVTNPDLTGF